MTTTVEHLSKAERAARGKAARAEVPRSSHWGGSAGRAARPRRGARGAGADARAGAGPDPLRADARLAVHVLPRRGGDHGRRPRGDAADGPAGAALRRRAPVELRCLRGARPAAGLRRQRLRRDAARPVRVGRQAARRELRGGRPRPRVRRQAAGGGQPARRRGPTARRCATFAEMRALDLWYARLDVERTGQALGRAARRAKQLQAIRAQRRQGAREGQPARLEPADRDGRRRAADHQRPAADRPDRGAHARRSSAIELERGDPRVDPLLPAHAAERPPAPARALPLRRTPRARSSASAASARARGSC